MSLWRPGIVLPSDKLAAGVISEIKNALTPAQAVALTAWAEARSRFDGRKWVSNPLDAMVDIINIIDNRAKDPRWAAVGHKGVCLARRQFSCWDTLGGPANFYALMDRAQRLLAGQLPTDKLLGCLAAATGCVEGKSLVDTLSGSTHYYAPASMLPAGAVPPWIKPPARFVTERHGHRFYTNVR